MSVLHVGLQTQNSKPPKQTPVAANVLIQVMLFEKSGKATLSTMVPKTTAPRVEKPSVSKRPTECSKASTMFKGTLRSSFGTTTVGGGR